MTATKKTTESFGEKWGGPPLMKLVIESPEKLTESDLEEIVDMWKRKC